VSDPKLIWPNRRARISAPGRRSIGRAGPSRRRDDTAGPKVAAGIAARGRVEHLLAVAVLNNARIGLADCQHGTFILLSARAMRRQRWIAIALPIPSRPARSCRLGMAVVEAAGRAADAETVTVISVAT
jgi:hypothetical protein